MAQLTHRKDRMGTETIRDEIDLLGLYYRLIEKAKYIIVASLIGAILALLITVLFITPQYTATSKLYVLNSRDSVINLSDLQIGNYLAADYREVFQERIVIESVRKNLGLNYDYEQMRRMINVINPSNTRLLYINVTSASPEEAMNLANECAKVAREFISQTMDTDPPNIFADATYPLKPSSPSKVKNTLIGFISGLVLSCGIIVAKFLADDRIRTSEDIQRHTGLTTIGMMPLSDILIAKAKVKKDNVRDQMKRWENE